MATAPSPPRSFQMSPSDLIKKEPLDYGGFGDVFLCYHVTLGQVVMKTMYTGCLRSDESKRSLLEEGNIMASLNHERVVKLLGVIMEERDCSLVMELIPRGNLLVMLQTVTVPLSIKGRIILEILEGMVYLTAKRVIHKDIKPENILVDKDFHIKIADLGLATYQTWSKLTKEESRRRSRLGQVPAARGAGTLSYMAPEHLESIHTASTEKSDIYSFAIVVWAILTQEEPYANARSEDHISQCVRNGDRPAEDLIPDGTPEEIIQLMKDCWNHSPQLRPTFKEGYNRFLPFYKEKLEPHVEEAVLQLNKLYEGPADLVEKMSSLSVNECLSADCPAPLVSTDRSVPVEASVEDMHLIQNEPKENESIQTDARVLESPPSVPEKLQRELWYHNFGSYDPKPQLDPEGYGCHQVSSNPFLQNHHDTTDHSAKQQEQDVPFVSSVHSWSKPAPVQPASQDEMWCRPSSGLYHSMNTNSATAANISMSTSCPSLDQFNQLHPHSHFDRQPSWPAYPVSDTSAPDVTPGRLLNPSKSSFGQDLGSIVIQHAKAIQIGHYNTMTIRSLDSSQSLPSSANSLIKEGVRKHEDHAVTEKHLDLLRDNIGTNWKRCARHLGLTDVEIQTIEHDYCRDGLPEMVHQMLERWKMKEGSLGCTIGKLYQALAGNIKIDVIQKMLDMCSATASTMS